MESSQILQSGILDIIFSGRNKAYGAYQLRKTYNRRLLVALSGTIIIILIFFLVKTLTVNPTETHAHPDWIVDDNSVSRIPPEEPVQLRPPSLPAKVLPKLASVQFTHIRITNKEEVMAPPPDAEQLQNANIALSTQSGPEGSEIIAPPAEEKSSGVIFHPVAKKDARDSIEIMVDIQASFPGGTQAWTRYVRKAVESELDDFTEKDYGTCIVRFVVDKQGNVSDVKATTLHGTKLAEIAVNAIRKGPRWIPAQRNGHYVNAYRLQPVTLKNPNQ